MIRDLKGLSPRTRWMVRQLSIYIFMVLLVVLIGLVISRRSYARAEAMFNMRLEQIQESMKAEYEARDAMPLSAEGERIRQAEAIAKVLYGVKDNNSTDLRTACWCIFNRADSPGYPDSIDEVIGQPAQWMRYSEDNPVLEELYEIAREELDTYLDGSRRPCDRSFVFMDWSPEEIVLRDEFNASRSTKYWREK